MSTATTPPKTKKPKSDKQRMKGKKVTQFYELIDDWMSRWHDPVKYECMINSQYYLYQQYECINNFFDKMLDGPLFDCHAFAELGADWQGYEVISIQLSGTFYGGATKGHMQELIMLYSDGSMLNDSANCWPQMHDFDSYIQGELHSVRHPKPDYLTKPTELYDAKITAGYTDYEAMAEYQRMHLEMLQEHYELLKQANDAEIRMPDQIEELTTV